MLNESKNYSGDSMRQAICDYLKMSNIEFYRLMNLLNGESLNDCKEVILMFKNLMQQVLNAEHGALTIKSDLDSKVMLELLIFKLNALDLLIDANSDPSIIIPIVRVVYEQIGLFNLMYRLPQDQDEIDIIYKLWIISGLKYRQKFKSIIEDKDSINGETELMPQEYYKYQEESKVKQKNELIAIEKLTNEVRSSEKYKSLSDASKKIIDEKIKSKKYLIVFNKNEVIGKQWLDLIKTMGIKNNKLQEIYTYYSFYSHPTFASLMQFNEYKNPNNLAAFQIKKNMLRITQILLGVFVADYFYLHPKVKIEFQKLDHFDQRLINTFIIMGRGEDYSLLKDS